MTFVPNFVKIGEMGCGSTQRYHDDHTTLLQVEVFWIPTPCSVCVIRRRSSEDLDLKHSNRESLKTRLR